MKLSLIAFIVLMLSSGALKASAATQTAVVDKAISDAYAAISALDKCSRAAPSTAAAPDVKVTPPAALPPDPFPESVDPAKFEAQCREKFALSSILQDDKAWMDLIDFPAAEKLLECQAAASGGVGACVDAAPFEKANGNVDQSLVMGRARCKTAVQRLLFSKALITGSKEAMDRCKLTLAQEGTDAGMVDSICGKIIASGGDPESGCASAPTNVKVTKGADPKNDCRRFVRLWWGTETNCAGTWGADKDSVERCGVVGAFRRAAQSQDSSKCGANAECLALMSGKPASCAALLKPVVTNYCTNTTKAFAMKFDPKKVAAYRAARAAEIKGRKEFVERQRRDLIEGTKTANFLKQEKSCTDLFVAANASMKNAYDRVYGIEPKSGDVFDAALDKLQDMGKRWLEVSTDIAERASKKPKAPAPKPTKSTQ